MGVNAEEALNLISNNQNTLDATGMDSQALLRRLSIPWSAESALKDCKAFAGYYDLPLC